MEFHVVNAQEVMHVCWDKEDLYNAATRNGYFLPDFNSPCLTRTYLNGVINGIYASLKYKEMKFFKLTEAPSKTKLFKYIK